MRGGPINEVNDLSAEGSNFCGVYWTANHSINGKSTVFRFEGLAETFLQTKIHIRHWSITMENKSEALREKVEQLVELHQSDDEDAFADAMKKEETLGTRFAV